jgi:hypothetical protein
MWARLLPLKRLLRTAIFGAGRDKARRLAGVEVVRQWLAHERAALVQVKKALAALA